MRGDVSHLNPNPKPACFARAYLLLPRGTRSPLRVRACHGAFYVASSDATVTSVVPGKIHSPLWVLRGRITVGARPRLSCFLRERHSQSSVAQGHVLHHVVRILTLGALIELRCSQTIDIGERPQLIPFH